MPQRSGEAVPGEIHRLMFEAAACYGRGEFAGAGARCERVLAHREGFPEALHLLGLCRWKGGDLEGALNLLTRAQELQPADAQLWYNLGIVREQSGDTSGAQAAFRRAAELNPRDAESHYNLGVTCEALGDRAAAEAAYRRALRVADRHTGAAAGLAALCEAQNRLEEAQQWVDTALRGNPADAVAGLTQAQLDFRAGRYTQTAARLEAQLKCPLSPVNLSLTLGRLGSAYDRLGKHAAAYAVFMRAKEVLRDMAGDAPKDSVYGLASANRMQRLFDVLIKDAGVEAREPAAVSPVFLLGFPRSGTTLLDQILSSHSRIVVLEEKHTLQDILNEYAVSAVRLAEFADCDGATLQHYRERYWARVAEFMPDRPPDKLFVDKLPLNTLLLPLIRRLFPQARYLFAVRDPRDVVLSCFMQSFEPNEAMRHFFTLESTVRYYTAVMGVGLLALQAFPQCIHRLRYEDLVEDIQAEAKRLLAFLGLHWEPPVLEFHKTARQRHINTPSYHQVAQPIYQSARGRWQHYANHLQPVLPRLRTFVEYFGYP